MSSTAQHRGELLTLPLIKEALQDLFGEILCLPNYVMTRWSLQVSPSVIAGREPKVWSALRAGLCFSLARWNVDSCGNRAENNTREWETFSYNGYVFHTDKFILVSHELEFSSWNWNMELWIFGAVGGKENIKEDSGGGEVTAVPSCLFQHYGHLWIQYPQIQSLSFSAPRLPCIVWLTLAQSNWCLAHTLCRF